MAVWDLEKARAQDSNSVFIMKYLDKGPTGQQLFNTAEGKSFSLEQQVKERIDKLKEDLFFKNQLE